MTKLIIGYSPLSQSMDAPGDRRRLIFWANHRGHKIETDLTKRVDVIVASEASNFVSPFFRDSRTPIILDLVDAYLCRKNLVDDLARGLGKRLSGQISAGVKPFSKYISEFCTSANAVICSSLEQESLISPLNSNTHIILDSHEEIPFLSPRSLEIDSSIKFRILWEGQPATIRGMKEISSVLSQLSKTQKLELQFVTDQQYFKFLGKYHIGNTNDLLEKDLSAIMNYIKLTPWSINSLISAAKKSSVAMLPIDQSVPMQRLKPENRLLIMWRLGLPCLTSATPSYERVALKSGVDATCKTLDDWFRKFNVLRENPRYARAEIDRAQDYVRTNHNKENLLRQWDQAIGSVLR